MYKKFLAAAAMLFAVASFAAVDANKGTVAELDGLKGVGPAMSKRIVDARQQSAFKDWTDLMTRVKGVKEKAAVKLSAEGLTVNGESYKGGAPAAKSAKVAKADSKADATAKPTKP